MDFPGFHMPLLLAGSVIHNLLFLKTVDLERQASVVFCFPYEEGILKPQAREWYLVT
jgi:hypothetical protein